MAEISHCCSDHNRFGLAYHIGFVHLFNRLPAQRPLEIDEELLGFVAMQLVIDQERLGDYATRQRTVPEHQACIRQYLGLRSLGTQEAKTLEGFIFEESCRLEQTIALQSRAEEFLRDRGILPPAVYALKRVIIEQRKLARECIFERDTLSTKASSAEFSP